jgi:hypothetical protein
MHQRLQQITRRSEPLQSALDDGACFAGRFVTENALRGMDWGARPEIEARHP